MKKILIFAIALISLNSFAGNLNLKVKVFNSKGKQIGKSITLSADLDSYATRCGGDSSPSTVFLSNPENDIFGVRGCGGANSDYFANLFGRVGYWFQFHFSSKIATAIMRNVTTDQNAIVAVSEEMKKVYRYMTFDSEKDNNYKLKNSFKVGEYEFRISAPGSIKSLTY